MTVRKRNEPLPGDKAIRCNRSNLNYIITDVEIMHNAGTARVKFILFDSGTKLYEGECGVAIVSPAGIHESIKKTIVNDAVKIALLQELMGERYEL